MSRLAAITFVPVLFEEISYDTTILSANQNSISSELYDTQPLCDTILTLSFFIYFRIEESIQI